MPSLLKYKAAYINFIYSFAWDTTKSSFEELWEALKSDEIDTGQPRKWRREKLHQRYMDFNGKGRKYGAYRPSLLTGCQDALYITEEASEFTEVITPLKNYWQSHIDSPKYVSRCPVYFKYYMRILENGAGVCTLSVRVDGRKATFENIHRVLHLGQNVSFSTRDPNDKTPYVCSYLSLTDADAADCWLGRLRKLEKAELKDRQGGPIDISMVHDIIVNGEQLPESVFTLHEVFNRLLVIYPERSLTGWLNLEKRNESLWLDWQLLNGMNGHGTNELVIEHSWQNPYVFTIAELPAPAQGQQFSVQDVMNRRVKEFASTLTKMNLENECITTDFECIGDDYVRNSLQYNNATGALLNLSHDDRLFFSFSRRGALAVTANMDKIPGYFVLPSFVNILEILRARWHLGNVVNLALDDAIEKLVGADGSRTAQALDAVYRARMMLTMFLRDPVPYLFDGGAVTEIAQLADTELWLSRLRVSAEDKLNALDKLIQHRELSEAYASLRKYSDAPESNNKTPGAFEDYVEGLSEELGDDSHK